jgi:hypothetical protein
MQAQPASGIVGSSALPSKFTERRAQPRENEEITWNL